MKRNSKIIITSITAACLLFVYYNYDYKYVPSYSVVHSINNGIFLATYRYGKVYIVKNINIVKDVDENDIVIIDQRDGKDPNMKVISSHRIVDRDIRNDIIEIISEYEKLYPSKWNRTINSMRLEWFIHNIFYDLNLKRNHTDNVDLDNNDEEKYNKEYLNKILKI